MRGWRREKRDEQVQNGVAGFYASANPDVLSRNQPGYRPAPIHMHSHWKESK